MAFRISEYAIYTINTPSTVANTEHEESSPHLIEVNTSQRSPRPRPTVTEGLQDTYIQCHVERLENTSIQCEVERLKDNVAQCHVKYLQIHVTQCHVEGLQFKYDTVSCRRLHIYICGTVSRRRTTDIRGTVS